MDHESFDAGNFPSLHIFQLPLILSLYGWAGFLGAVEVGEANNLKSGIICVHDVHCQRGELKHASTFLSIIRVGDSFY